MRFCKRHGFTLIELLVVIVIIALLVTMALGLLSGGLGGLETVTITITKTESVGGIYKVFTADEAFVVARSARDKQYEPSRVYGKLISGRTYTVKVRGWDNEAWGQFRNIVEIVDEAR